MVFQDQVSYVVMGSASNIHWQLLVARIGEAIRQLQAYFDLRLGRLDSYAQLHHFVMGSMVQYARALFHFLHKTSSIHH